MIRQSRESGTYHFKVKMYHLRGVNISDGDLEFEVEKAFEAFVARLHRRYSWIGNVFLTGRSAGWLAVEDTKGLATKEKLLAIDEMVQKDLRKFQDNLRARYGEQ